MRILLLNQHVTIKAVHLRNGENADAAKAAGRNIQNLALRNVGLELARSIALQTEERDVTRLQVALHCTACNIRLRKLRLKLALHDKLIAHMRVFEQTGSSVAAMEAHESLV